MPLSRQQVRQRARKIQLLLFDVDGVLTDGRIFYVPGPEGKLFETKGFHTRDGIGLRYARQAGLKLGIITGRSSEIVRYRAAELRVDFLEQGNLKKITSYEKILKVAGVADAEVCYVGDDLVDLPIIKRAGLGVCVSDGDPFVRRAAHYLTRFPGGAGAIRETVELILEAQGKWQTVLDQYQSPSGKGPQLEEGNGPYG